LQNRPKAVFVVAVFLFAATVMAAVAGTSLLFPETFLDRIWELNPQAHAGFKPLGRASGLLLLMLGVATGAAAAGLLRARRWAWLLAIAVFTLNGLGDFISLLIGGDLVKSGSGVLIAAIFLATLLRPRVAIFFEEPG